MLSYKIKVKQLLQCLQLKSINTLNETLFLMDKETFEVIASIGHDVEESLGKENQEDIIEGFCESTSSDVNGTDNSDDKINKKEKNVSGLNYRERCHPKSLQ